MHVHFYEESRIPMYLIIQMVIQELLSGKILKPVTCTKSVVTTGLKDHFCLYTYFLFPK